MSPIYDEATLERRLEATRVLVTTHAMFSPSRFVLTTIGCTLRKLTVAIEDIRLLRYMYRMLSLYEVPSARTESFCLHHSALKLHYCSFGFGCYTLLKLHPPFPENIVSCCWAGRLGLPCRAFGILIKKLTVQHSQIANRNWHAKNIRSMIRSGLHWIFKLKGRVWLYDSYVR